MTSWESKEEDGDMAERRAESLILPAAVTAVIVVRAF
jgi:hypothetical protein